jgi:hypothetical protein
MAIDLKALDRKIKKLQRFREFAKELDGDPEFRQLIAEFSTKNGNGTKPATSADIRPSHDSNSNAPERPRGYFVGAVRGVIMELGHQFTSRDIEDKIASKGIAVIAANTNVAINEALATLEKRGEVVRDGKRGVQVLWRKSISA